MKGWGKEPIHHMDPDRPLIQLTDRDARAAGMIRLRAVGEAPLYIMKVCLMQAPAVV